MTRKTACLAFILLLVARKSLALQFIKSEDDKLSFKELAIKYGGAAEEYDVTTSDGYILKLFRILGDQTKPVLLVHGLMCSSNEFMATGNYSLPVTLTNSGYDVWFLNYRGNRYSRRHVTLDPDKDTSFWQFGPHQHGNYDLAASIDFVLNKTGETKLSLIGHSEGPMITYMLGSERPEYNSKIKVFIGLAPAAYTHYMSKDFPNINQFSSTVRSLLHQYKIEELARYDSISVAMFRKFCSHRVGIEVCRHFASALARFNGESPDDIAHVFSNFPAGTSRMNLEHAIQMIISKRFRNYDYGPEKNLLKYKSKNPPDYNWSRVSMRVHLIGARNDVLAAIEDAEQQYQELPNVAELFIIEDNFSHMDFVWSRKAKHIVHPKVLQILKNYNE